MILTWLFALTLDLLQIATSMLFYLGMGLVLGCVKLNFITKTSSRNEEKCYEEGREGGTVTGEDFGDKGSLQLAADTCSW